MRTLFENATVMNPSDCEQFAISVAATELALQTGDAPARDRIMQVAYRLRQNEYEILYDDGKSTAELTELRRLGAVEDNPDDDVFLAHRLVWAELRRLAAQL